MLRRYSKARSATSAISQNDVTQTYKPQNVEMYEKRVQELTKAVEESQKKADWVSSFCYHNNNGNSRYLQFRM